jgi:hypothetical protein
VIALSLISDSLSTNASAYADDAPTITGRAIERDGVEAPISRRRLSILRGATYPPESGREPMAGAAATRNDGGMRRRSRRRNPFSFLFTPSARDQHLVQYLLREHKRGRALYDVLEDSYVRNRSTTEERARLLDQPDLVAALGKRAVDDLRLSLAARR